jgi:phosphoribosylanthranilate isomerase
MTRIKCCGMTRVEDALLAAGLGVDAIGLVFSGRSKRCVTVAQGRAIRRALPPFISTVALFMDDDVALVDEVIASVQPDALQFHGRESDTWCSRFDRPFIKAIAMGEGAAALPRLHEYPHAAALLLDGHGWGEAGGSGRAFEWSLMPRELGRPLVLAGGLDPSNVAGAIRTARPWAVDVASGVETSPGIKDAAKMERFIAAVRRASAP